MAPQTLLVDPDGRGRGKSPILVECDFVTNATKGGLISEGVSLWLKYLKKSCQITIRNIRSKKKMVKIVIVFGDLCQSEKSSEIEPLL